MARATPKVVKPADQINKNWVAAMQSATTQNKYKDSINRVTVNPMAIAASDASEQKYLAKVQASVTSGKRGASLMAADPGMWKQNAMTIGAAALGTGAVKKSAKQLKRMQAWQPVYQQASNAAAAVPDDGNTNVGKWQAAVAVLKAAKGHT
jgi:hypothetical protein